MTASHEHSLSELPEAVLRPVRGHHAFEACVEQLATAIRLGVYPLGTTLPPERELAVMLRVSRATLREAMAALREAGLVETTRGRGGGTVVTLKPRTPSARAAARVSPERRRDWLDALEYRRIVEPGAAYVAAALELSDARRAQLEEAHAAVIDAPKPAAHRQADSRLHLTIASLADSPRLIEAVTSVQATLHEMLLAIPVLQANIAHSDRQHAVVVKAILAGDADRARRAMEEHCDDTAALLRGLVG
ncbi:MULTISPECIES: FadR/GntR family transcriptional regulator [unclassified Nocardioides]|uniref:FadR/GntR family transcriptional regulator n=1 Tax=unclassified Nocardioides TaxID=2615069 RepID=UPI0009EFB872|nr:MULTISPECIES: FCD domain-containing protein [unclassified Nocardioides]GAW48321.1 GntR family transcriptional regulator [Nocardioides sp. PD653-B2]GAW53246.1 GntR family transcriptional regulator [Nocardioides sp. PD653]